MGLMAGSLGKLLPSFFVLLVSAASGLVPILILNQWSHRLHLAADTKRRAHCAPAFSSFFSVFALTCFGPLVVSLNVPCAGNANTGQAVGAKLFLNQRASSPSNGFAIR